MITNQWLEHLAPFPVYCVVSIWVYLGICWVYLENHENLQYSNYHYYLMIQEEVLNSQWIQLEFIMVEVHLTTLPTMEQNDGDFRSFFIAFVYYSCTFEWSILVYKLYYGLHACSVQTWFSHHSLLTLAAPIQLAVQVVESEHGRRGWQGLS